MAGWLLPLAALAGGLAALVWSADFFVDGASGAARRLGAPALVIGMVIVGFGTSAPEMAVSAVGAVRGAPSIALGNAYGSNICNIALILGLCALLRPLAVNRSAVRFAIPAVLFSTAFSALLVADSALGPGISRADSLVLLALFAVSLFLMARDSAGDAAVKNAAAQPGAAEKAAEPPSLGICAAKVVLGIAALVLSSRALVWGAVEAATKLGVSDLVIGLTVVAVGTSLPELASSVAAVRRGEDDLAVGNIVGSNLFNTLAVVGIAGAISPMPEVDKAILARDIPWSFVLALFLLAAGFPRRAATTGRLGRFPGAVLLVSYAAYLALLVRASTA